MKLLFDHNLSFRLIDQIPIQFKESSHVYLLDLSQSDDITIWNYALENGFTLITKDTDFFDLVSLKGFPPKVIWIKRGNCSTQEIATIISENSDKIISFIEDDENGILIID
jgi:predicted nuclease of predicted toxin-antitoxin system